MLTFTIIFVTVVILAGVAALIHAVSHAPVGFEDEQGFHARPVPASALAMVPVTSDSAAGRSWFHGSLTAHVSTHAPF
jgi:hypothetical protein